MGQPGQQDHRVLIFVKLDDFGFRGAQQGPPDGIIAVSALRTKYEAAVHERNDRLRVVATRGAKLRREIVSSAVLLQLLAISEGRFLRRLLGSRRFLF